MISFSVRANLFKKLVVLFTAILMALGLMPKAPLPKDGIKADAITSFSDNVAGSAAGMISVSANYDGDYQLYWGDAEGKKLTAFAASGRTLIYSEFADITVSKGSGEETMNNYLAIPPQAQTILLYYGDTLLDTDDIPREKLANAAQPTYSFGTLSDVHFNRYDSSGGDDSDISYPRALNLLDEMGVSLVALSGDLSSKGEAASYESFRKYNEQHDFPVYTCRGNHDCKNQFSYEAWKANVNVGVFDGEEAPEGVLARSDNGFDFVYSGPEVKGDIFIFLSQCRDTYLPGVRLLEQDQIDWLKTQLDAYKNKRVYLYFHTFLSALQGDPRMGEGNIVNDYGYFYPLPYVKGNSDEQQFWTLMRQYRNVIFFNGHSHWAHSMQSYNKDLNIYSYEDRSAVMVHVSSVAAPRTTDILHPIQTSNPVSMSEGLYVAVFPRYVISYAMDFVNNKILAYATYRIAR